MKLARPFPSRFFAPLTLLFVAASLSGCDFIKDNSVLGLLEEEFETETLLDVHEFDSQTPTFVDRQLLPATMLPADGVVVDGRLFTFGDGTTDALIYDPADETWTTLPDLPEARVGARVVSEVAGTRVYIVTGTRPDGAPIRFIDHLDVAAGSPAWSRTEIDGGIDALSEAAVTVHAGSLFVFGGRDETGTITGDGYSFVLASATSATPLFAALPDVLPQARFLPAAFVAPDPQTSDPIIHITGGLSATGVGLTSEVLFDPALKTSSLAPDPVPNARTDPQIIEGNGEFFALWSRRIGFGRDDRVDVYDVATGTWTQTTSAPRTLQMTAAAFVDGHLHLFGGFTDELSVRDARFLNGTTWEELPGMPTRRHSAVVLLIPGTPNALVIGGAETTKKDIDVSPF